MAYILVVDESGKPSESVRGLFVIAGLLFPEEEMLKVRPLLAEIRRKFRLDPDTEFHTRDIVHGKRAFSGIREMSKRRSLIEELYNVLLHLRPLIVAVVGTNPVSDYNEALRSGYRYLVERALIAFDKISSDREIMLIIVDRTTYREDTLLAEHIQNEIAEGIFVSRWPISKRIVPRPLFIDSKTFEPLQLADLVSFTIRRGFLPRPNIGPMDFQSYYTRYIEPFLDHCKDGRVEGCGLKFL